MSNKSEIESLIFLLDDPDPDINIKVKNRLLELGEEAVPLLDQQKSRAGTDNKRELINEIIRWITYGSLEEDFLNVLDGGMASLKQLEEAVFVLSRFQNPTLREAVYKRKLDRFAAVIEPRLRYQLSSSKKMHVLLDFIFKDLNFTGNTSDYYHPDNSCLDRVIDRRKGLPISLGLIVLFMARRLDLPFHGINMPVHFMLKYESKKEEILIDPFDQGKIVTYNQCYYFLKQNGVDPRSTHFETAQESDILARCIRNMIQSYARIKRNGEVEDLQRLLDTVEQLNL